jgi:hypothetical protein
MGGINTIFGILPPGGNGCDESAASQAETRCKTLFRKNKATVKSSSESSLAGSVEWKFPTWLWCARV